MSLQEIEKDAVEELRKFVESNNVRRHSLARLYDFDALIDYYRCHSKYADKFQNQIEDENDVDLETYGKVTCMDKRLLEHVSEGVEIGSSQHISLLSEAKVLKDFTATIDNYVSDYPPLAVHGGDFSFSIRRDVEATDTVVTMNPDSFQPMAVIGIRFTLDFRILKNDSGC